MQSFHLLPYTNAIYNQACALRLKAYGSNNYTPAGDIASLAPGTYYLERIDEAYRRSYAIRF